MLMPLASVARRPALAHSAGWRREWTQTWRGDYCKRHFTLLLPWAFTISSARTRVLSLARRRIASARGTRLERRCIHIPTVLLPPVLFTALLLGLWTWKCFMLVVFQNKIIYMPGFPPTARRETIADYARLCRGIEWREETTKASDGTRLGLAVATVPLPSGGVQKGGNEMPPADVYVLYFQGNASSTPPRLPDISSVLRLVSDDKAARPMHGSLTFVCLSYRGYWTSRGRPSERGIRLDAEAGVRWTVENHGRKFPGGAGGCGPILILWGQSIGSGVATNLAASTPIPAGIPVRGMLLETPFLSVRAMLEVLYPQKWLPYKHLWPFLRNHLDSWTNLGIIAETSRSTGQKMPNIYILEADRDELVPKEHGDQLYRRCLDLGIPVEKGAAPVAFHSEAIARGEGKKLAAQAIVSLAEKALDDTSG